MLKRNLFLLFAITVFATASTILDIYNYNPYNSDAKVFINFYFSFFFAITGIFSIFFYYFKMKFFKDKKIYSYFWPSVRQAALFSASLTLILFLKGIRLLDFWSGAPLIIVILLMEFFFQTNPKSTRKINSGANL